MLILRLRLGVPGRPLLIRPFQGCRCVLWQFQNLDIRLIRNSMAIIFKLLDSSSMNLPSFQKFVWHLKSLAIPSTMNSGNTVKSRREMVR
jgi:hypothetical protein